MSTDFEEKHVYTIEVSTEFQNAFEKLLKDFLIIFKTRSSVSAVKNTSIKIRLRDDFVFNR